MATKKPILTHALEAANDLSGNLHYLAKVDSNGKAVLAGDGDLVFGVISEAAASGNYVTLDVAGIAKCQTGGSVTAGDTVASDANGKCVTVSTSTESRFGIALTGSGGADEIITVLIARE